MDNSKIAYFSMEIGIKSDMKTYAGGLGILAGDTLKTAADMGINMVGVSLLYKFGYFKQTFDENGYQHEEPDEWNIENYLENTGKRIEFELSGETVQVEIWKYEIEGKNNHVVPVYFLNTDLPENPDKFRYISFNLYTPYEETMLKQILTIGIAGVKALEVVEPDTKIYHLNESHAAFAIAELKKKFSTEDVSNLVRFTTHTPAKHGHRIYSWDNLKNYLSEDYLNLISEYFHEGKLHLTLFSMKNAKVSNGVSKRHAEVSNNMFKDQNVVQITNGAHLRTWTTNSTKRLFDIHLENWEEDPSKLELIKNVSDTELQAMHLQNKQELLEIIKTKCDCGFDLNAFTIGFSRRVDGYKRWDFILQDLNILKNIAKKSGPIQFVFAGKAYFDYSDGEEAIKQIRELSGMDSENLKIAFIPDYSMNIAKKMISGVDLWLNNPIKPLEASGTSGMKAAINGVPNFSTIDGWWVEGWQEDVTGWAIGNEFSFENPNNEESFEAYELYAKLQYKILPLFYNYKSEWIKVMRNAIAINGPEFNTVRMMNQYLAKSYGR